MHISQYAHFDFEDKAGNSLWPSVALELHQALSENVDNDFPGLAKSIRSIASNLHDVSHGASTFLYVLADLVNFKISFRLSDSGIWMQKHPVTREVISSQLLARRNESLEDASTQKFLDYCETTIARKQNSRKSIEILFHNGLDFSAELAKAVSKNLPIKSLIKPYIQPVSIDERDKYTNLKLTDIWRYCRLTWSLEHQPVPGRQLCFIIRNAACKNHPIMGIGALASPVLQHDLRDNWIGWSLDKVISDIVSKKKNIEWFLNTLEKVVDYSIDNLFITDFELSELDLSSPNQLIFSRLLNIAEKARLDREELLKDPEKTVEYRKKPRIEKMSGEEIVAHTQKNPLWVKKRAEKLAKLLQVRALINEVRKIKVYYKQGAILFQSEKNRSLTNFAWGEVRTLATASRIADLNVCGAIPPYNHLLGGKLVALSAVSRELQNIYSARYRTSISEISSFMAGKKIIQPTNLEVITTTSLYGKHTVQYNGLKLLKSKFPQLSHDVNWEKLGVTQGKGTFHISNKTSKIMNQFNASVTQGSSDKGFIHVNHVFGEGTSPKLRIIRQALANLGYDAEFVLQHNQERLFLAACLGKDSKDRLLDFNFTAKSRRNGFESLTDVWLEKWVSSRVQRTDVIERVSNESFEKVAGSLRPKSYEKQYKLI